MLTAEREAQLALVCTCGHARRIHMEEGPCLACISGGRGTAIAGSVCPCDRFQSVEAHARQRNARPAIPAESLAESWAAARPKAGRDRRAAAPTAEPAECSAGKCRSRATVVLERNGKAYCRPHGLGLALKRPRSEIRPLDAALTDRKAA